MHIIRNRECIGIIFYLHKIASPILTCKKEGTATSHFFNLMCLCCIFMFHVCIQGNHSIPCFMNSSHISEAR